MGSLRIISALALRYVPSPTRWVNTPMISRTLRTWRSEVRFTPNSLASSRSGRNLAPGTKAPVEISPLILLIRVAVTLVSLGSFPLVLEDLGMLVGALYAFKGLVGTRNHHVALGQFRSDQLKLTEWSIPTTQLAWAVLAAREFGNEVFS